MKKLNGCQGTIPLRKKCKKCKYFDASFETDYYPLTLKEAKKFGCKFNN